MSTYTASPLANSTQSVNVGGGAEQSFVLDRDIPAEWWQLFRSDALDRLVRDAVATSPNLAAARATLHAAQENYLALRGTALRPGVDAQLSGTRERFSGALFGQPNVTNLFNLFDAAVNVSYTLDLGGGVRSQLAAGRSQVAYQCFELEGSYLALTANLVTAAIREASLRAQLDASTKIVSIQQAQLDAMEQQFQAGTIALTDVLAQRSLLAQSSTTLPPLEKQLQQTRHQLAVLAGRPPSDTSLPQFALDDLQLPAELPVSLPASLLMQRPDLRSSKALLDQAAAQVGVAAAKLFPQVTLSGSAGSVPNDLRDLFASSATAYSIGAMLLQPLFHAGALRAKRAAAIDTYDRAAALYQQTVLQALQNVADALKAVEQDAAALRAQAAAETAAQASLDASGERFQLGAISSVELLTAQRDYQQSLVGIAKARADRFADTAALFAALGGGWWNRPSDEDACRDAR